MKYIKKYTSKITFDIFYQDENETKYVVDGENSPKVIEWLKTNQFEIIEFQEPNLNELKLKKIEEFKTMARHELSVNDYKIIRQYEEQTLSDNEFETLKAQRQAIRNKSNFLESQVLQSDNYETIMNINW